MRSWIHTYGVIHDTGNERDIVIKSMQLKLMIVYILNTVEIVSSDRRRFK